MQKRKKRGKYNKVIDELDSFELEKAREKVHYIGILEPWYLYFIDRFSKLAHDKGVSKTDICDSCNKPDYLNSFFKEGEKFSTSTLSSITNPSSKNVHLPSANHLIALSKYFDVSIDYLVGLSNTKNVELQEILNSLGITENSISLLQFYKKMSPLQKLSLFPESGLDTDDAGNIDINSLPTIDKGTGLPQKYYHGRKIISSKSVKAYMDNAIKKNPKYSNKKKNKPKTHEEYRALIPDKNFFQTLELLLTYDNAKLLNTMSKFLFSDPNRENADQEDAMFLSQIQTCLVRMQDSDEKRDVLND